MLKIWNLNLSYMYLINQHWTFRKRVQCQHILLIHGKCSILKPSDGCVKQKHAGIADMQRRGTMYLTALSCSSSSEAWCYVERQIEAHVTLARYKGRSIRTCPFSSFKQLMDYRGQNDLLHTFLWLNSEFGYWWVPVPPSQRLAAATKVY